MLRTALSILTAGILALGTGVRGQGPRKPADSCGAAAAARGQGASGPNAYFDMLVGRRECAQAYSLRDQSALENIETRAKTRPDKKRPITYDPQYDAARITIVAPTSADSQQKIVPLGIRQGSILLTWDFRFDENFKWQGAGYVARHKTWRIDPGPWFAIKTDYKRGSRQGHLAELQITAPGKKFLAPGTKRAGETLMPRLAPFYIEADTWVRIWILVEGLDQSTAHLSVWAADEQRDAVHLYDRIGLVPPKDGPAAFRIEYDTSADQGKNPKEMHSWNRNIVVLHNVARADVSALLQRPVGAPRR